MFTWKFSVLAICLWIGTSFASEIKGIDFFGSDRVTLEQLLASESDLFDQFFKVIEIENNESVEVISLQLSKRLREKFCFAYVRPTAITYFNDMKPLVYITIDVVEMHDAARRLSFLESPTKTLSDTDGLLALWDQYMEKAFQLLKKNEITSQIFQCAAFHSIFGNQHPELAPFEKIFIDGAMKNKDQLIDILYNEKNDHARANAVFILAYLTNGVELVNILEKSIRDSSHEVRNNVMRVYACIASNHPEIKLPFEKILIALDYPDTTDRNKAAAVIYGLLSHPEFFNHHAQTIQNSASQQLIKLIKLKQPNNSEWAYQILKLLSQKNFAKEDIAAWENWANSSKNSY